MFLIQEHFVSAYIQSQLEKFHWRLEDIIIGQSFTERYNTVREALPPNFRLQWLIGDFGYISSRHIL